MKKTVKVNINGYIFHIDEDAYEKLRGWLDALNKKFENEQGGDEIISDIEARVAELFQEEINSHKEVIIATDVENVIKIMGTPEDICDDEEGEPKNKQKTHFKESSKKLFRNPDNRFLGGICGGLGSYFNINPLIIRIIFIISIFFYGAGVFVYICVWILLPEAKTAGNKLEMQGERITISNIEKTIIDEFKTVKSNWNKWTQSKGYKNFRDRMGKFGKELLNVLKALTKIIVVIIGFLLMFTGIISFIGFTIAYFMGGTIAELSIPEISNINLRLTDFFDLFPMTFSSTLSIIAIYVLSTIPLLALGYIGSIILFKYKAKHTIITLTGFGVWLVALIIVLIFSFKTALHYKTSSSYTNSYVIENVNSDTLYLSVSENSSLDKDDLHFRIDNILISTEDNKTQFFGEPLIDIRKSLGEQIEIKVKYYAYGKTTKDATEFSREINYEWRQNDSIIEFDQYFTLPDDTKFQAQYVSIILYLPEGKSVYMSDNMKKVIYDIQNIQNMWDNNMVEKMWTMTEIGLNLSDSIKIIPIDTIPDIDTVQIIN